MDFKIGDIVTNGNHDREVIEKINSDIYRWRYPDLGALTCIGDYNIFISKMNGFYLK